MATVKFGVTIDPSPEIKGDYNAIREVALQAERLGYYSLWIIDHFISWRARAREGDEGAVFEVWTLLSALSTEIKKMKLGSLVACNSYRNPTLTAKMAASLDVISNGRLLFGYGAGWFKKEYEAYGFQFHRPSIRVKQMREGLILIKKLWTEERTSFNGDYYNSKEAICNPKPVQKPHPPIIVGGGGEKYTLRVAAELGDGWDIWGASVEEYERKVDILTRYCEEFGRRIEDMELSWSGDIILAEDEKQLKRKVEKYKIQEGIFCSYDECIETLQRYIDLGCSHFIFSLYTFHEEYKTFLEELGQSF